MAMRPLSAVDVFLLVAGDGPLRIELLALASRLGVEKRVRFLGHLDRVDGLLRAADAFVLPSIYEGLPVALLEAMALGVPAVVSDLPELHELAAGDALELVPAGDERALAAAVAGLLADPARARSVAERGTMRVATGYDARANALLFLDLLKRVVRNPSRSSESGPDQAA